MKVYLGLNYNELKDGKTITTDIVQIYSGGKPSPYPDNFMCDIEDDLKDPILVNDFPKYQIEVECKAVLDPDGKVMKAKHPDKTKDGKYDNYIFIQKSKPILKTDEEIVNNDKYIEKVRMYRRQQFEKEIDRFNMEFVEVLIDSVLAGDIKVKKNDSAVELAKMIKDRKDTIRKIIK